MAPGSSVDIEQLVLAIPRIQFVLHLGQPVVIDGTQETLREFLDLWSINGLDIGAGTAKLERMLAAAAHDDFSYRFAIAKERAIGNLLVASAGNHFLHHGLACADQARCFLKHRFQFRMTIGAPRFCFGGINKVLFNCGLDCKRRLETVKFRELINVLDVVSARGGDSKFLGEPICVALVPSPLHALKIGRWNTKYLAQFRAALRERGDVFIPRGIQDPSAQI